VGAATRFGGEFLRTWLFLRLCFGRLPRSQLLAPSAGFVGLVGGLVALDEVFEGGDQVELSAHGPRMTVARCRRCEGAVVAFRNMSKISCCRSLTVTLAAL